MVIRAGTRRSFLRMAGVSGIAGLAGCVGSSSSGSGGDNGSGSSGGQSMTIAILSAGSLENALLSDFKATVDVPIQVESHGSSEVARLIDEELRDPDIVALADTVLFDTVLTPPWYSVFTSNAVVIAVNEDTKPGQRVAKAGKDGWYKPMVDGGVKIGRTPPKQDPLGYRTLFMFDLASRYYEGANNLRKKIPKRGQIYPETGLLSRFETGAIDAAIVYRNMAVERGYEYIDLPDQIDLSNPQYVEEWYSKTSYTLPDGKKIRGDLIAYGATIHHMSDAALSTFDVLTTGSYLTEHGFILREQFPTYEGDVPKRVKQAVSTAGNQLSTHPPNLSADVSDITLLT
ncbi:MAG TPA: extracellular solute-binding protein [Halococcus sp.]|nr:extracellular solute-binding protein [Halococcus sp.]